MHDQTLMPDHGIMALLTIEQETADPTTLQEDLKKYKPKTFLP